jgi:zeaxanthin glucosyltransferase
MKIGFLSLPVTGHLNSMTGLARKLQSRGHEVVFIGVPDTERVIRAADLHFVPFCENEYPPGSIDKSWGRGSESTWPGCRPLYGPGIVARTT